MIQSVCLPLFPAWKGEIICPFAPTPSAGAAYAEIETFARGNAGSVWHPTGTAAMSPVGARGGVVDPGLKVKGVEGMRVVDLSVLPYIVSGHTQGATYLVGGK